MKGNEMRVLLALGANVAGAWGTPREAVERAARELPGRGVEVLAPSPLLVTRPVGGIEQPDFVNGALIGETRLTPAGLLAALKALEREAGRTDTVRWGPRALDIDIIFYGDQVHGWRDGAPGDDARLVIPHPEMHKRAFVLEPAAAIAADWRHPVLGLSVGQMLEIVKS
jgi:dihydroneopterin aldolase/2-amino-4-hydroxy-6-hydroxymethyldihydropteridine diphosphokinase